MWYVDTYAWDFNEKLYPYHYVFATRQKLSSAYFSLESSERFQYCFISDEIEWLLKFVAFTTSRIKFIAQGEEIKKGAGISVEQAGNRVQNTDKEKLLASTVFTHFIFFAMSLQNGTVPDQFSLFL